MYNIIGINDAPNLELKILNYINYDKVGNSYLFHETYPIIREK